MHKNKKSLYVFACVLATVTIVYFLIQNAWNTHTHNFYIEKIPSVFEVTDITYSEHASSGFTPSGHEGGIVIYQLPDKILQQILEHGIHFFYEHASIESDESTGDFQQLQWQETPVQLNEKWTGPTIGGEPTSHITKPQIEVFVNRWAYLLSLDGDIQNRVDTAISQRDSFYTYLPSGNIIIVIPNAQQIIFAYSG